MTARLALVLAALAAVRRRRRSAPSAPTRSRRGSRPTCTAVWQTAVQYHAWHALGLLASGCGCCWSAGAPGSRSPPGCFVAGIVLFSGSLYALALTGVRGLGAVTPFGGVAFLAGWVALAWAAWRRG